MKLLTTFIILIFIYIMAKAQPIPTVISGKIDRINDFKSNFIDNRIIDIWLPENYSNQKKYAVLYMQDGQMLYDAATTWNKQAWEIDDVLSKLFQENKIVETIVVGVWNGGKVRHATYFPQKPYENLSENDKEILSKKLQQKSGIADVFLPNSDNYLQFLIQELKPYIDRKYSVYTDLDHTFIGGSSMGALVSLYAICEYPNIFGGAICMSTHWSGTFDNINNPIPDAFFSYLADNLPDPNNHKIYFDYGDQTLDALYPKLQKQVDKIMIKKGYSSKNWVTQFFAGKDHSEKSWSERLNIPLEFILKVNK